MNRAGAHLLARSRLAGDQDARVTPREQRDFVDLFKEGGALADEKLRPEPLLERLRLQPATGSLFQQLPDAWEDVAGLERGVDEVGGPEFKPLEHFVGLARFGDDDERGR